MGSAIAHRGPDDAQYFDDGTLALVYRRLSIIDIEGGRQPMFNETGDLLLAANGEIYNHAALRSQLCARHTFSSRSDCEAPLHAYEEWGESAFARLHGMFAMAVWSLRNKKLTLARDRLGIKPLYICQLPSGILFGSELKALLAHPDCPRTIEWSVIDRTSISQSPRASYVKGIELVPGGELVVVDAMANIQRRRYWQLDDHLGTARFGNDAVRYIEEYGNLLEQVTLEHLQRDVGAGLHLSGGVDSSLLAGIVARRETDIPCFTVVERTNHLGGDTEAAQRLTQQLSLPWVPVRFDYRTVVDEMDFRLSRLEEVVWMMDSPRIDLEWLFKDQLHRLARARHPNLKVMLIGQGADEFAGGYSSRLDEMRGSWSEYLREEVEPNLVFDKTLEGHAPNSLWQYLSHRRTSQPSPAPYHRMMLLMVRQLQHHNLWHEDRTSSWNSLEARVPFLDHRLVELLASVPEELHEQLFWKKRIVREALRRFLPDHVIRQPKIGFLESRDTSSQDVIVHNMLRRTVDDFREKYLADDQCLFDTRRMDALIRQALDRGPQCGVAARQLLQCMAVSIFERQCREGTFDSHEADGSTSVLHVVDATEWPAFDAAMKLPPKCVRDWSPSQRIGLRKGIELLTPVGGDGRRHCFLLDGVSAGEFSVAQGKAWPEVFLRNLGSPLTRDFTIQDWLDEFDIALSDFAELLNILFHLGVLAGDHVSQTSSESSNRAGSDQKRDSAPQALPLHIEVTPAFVTEAE
jgi:asparagine synthase (glutamine-hydrolysing)